MFLFFIGVVCISATRNRCCAKCFGMRRRLVDEWKLTLGDGRPLLLRLSSFVIAVPCETTRAAVERVRES